ncbi:LADA_0B07492g1_1 [Lachancea dasiensis]|uniref:LADA_0B07492g1_1 n=1 Tax=Lachancea dasiensis TaxID=1072105 RepID=A0A1G4IUD6_9SACH|nr:LADA_0B07492g1_1 [Lachancea dasiensis]
MRAPMNNGWFIGLIAQIHTKKQHPVPLVMSLPVKDDTLGSPKFARRPPIHKIKAELELSLAFVFASILGNYSRLALTTLTDYPGAYVEGPTILWSNIAACFIMGLMQIIYRYKVISPLLFTAITTGYCGSLSSFSSLMVELFEHSADQLQSNVESYPNNGYAIMEFLAVLFVQLLACMCSHIFGLFVAKELALSFKDFESKELSLPARRVRHGFDIIEKIVMALALPVLVVQIVLAGVYGNFSRYWTLSAIFAFPGTQLRYGLSKWLNPTLKYFPLGTFAANVFGSLVLAILTLVSRGKSQDGSYIVAPGSTAQTVVIALGNGFCGCLTTISTFINECHRLSLSRVVIYYFCSIFFSFCLVVVTLGSYAWTRGIA